MNKREFIKSTAAILALAPITSLARALKSFDKKEVLILGGRGFLGPSIVNQFLEAGHNVTLLNRGITNPQLFNDLDIIICDREKENREGLKEAKAKVNAKQWDIVIDTWQKSPKAVQDFLEEFGNRIGHYHYISTIAVYDKWDRKNISENGKLTPLPEFPKTISEDFRYAVRKTFAEVSIMTTSNLRWSIYRCHGIRSNRLPIPGNPHEEPYWPIRFLKGGDILLPDIEGHHIQMTDAKSLTNFIVSCAEDKIEGVFNVAYKPIPFKEYIRSVIKATERPHKLHWIPDDFLIQNDVLPYKEIEYWSRSVGAYYFSVEKAISKGLENRPLANMISDQIVGYKERFPNEDFQFGGVFDDSVVKLSSEKEKAVIQKWLSNR